jgi:hypothetical protein
MRRLRCRAGRCSTSHAVNAHGRVRLVVRVLRSWVDGATHTVDEGTDALGKGGREVGV